MFHGLTEELNLIEELRREVTILEIRVRQDSSVELNIRRNTIDQVFIESDEELLDTGSSIFVTYDELGDQRVIVGLDRVPSING